MGIKMTTPMQALNAQVSQSVEAIKFALVYKMEEIGQRVVNEARSYNGKQYLDQTNNLRSSIGYIIVVDGQVQSRSDFTPCGNGTQGDGAQGSADGAHYASQLASQIPQGVALIVVAGMDYAEHLHNKGYNVLTSAEILAEQEMKAFIADFANYM